MRYLYLYPLSSAQYVEHREQYHDIMDFIHKHSIKVECFKNIFWYCVMADETLAWFLLIYPALHGRMNDCSFDSFHAILMRYHPDLA